MPTPFMHLASAQEILADDPPSGMSPARVSRLLNEQRGAFLLGQTGPDVQTVSGQARDETHFYAIPRTSRRPAYQALFAAHPRLARVDELPPPQVAFIAGYIAHLTLDEIWLEDVFLRYFAGDRETWRERAFAHNVLRTWMDAQARRRLDQAVTAALRSAEPDDWLPFVADVHIRRWRDWLIEQLTPGHHAQTAEVFAQRMGVSAAEIEAVLRAPEQMEARVFRRIPRAALQTFHDAGQARSVALIKRYVNGDIAG